VFCIYESPEDGHQSGPKHVVEVIHSKLQILLRTEVWKKCLIGTRATGCITQKLRMPYSSQGAQHSGTWMMPSSGVRRCVHLLRTEDRWRERFAFVSASHRDLSSAPSRNLRTMMPDACCAVYHGSTCREATVSAPESSLLNPNSTPHFPMHWQLDWPSHRAPPLPKGLISAFRASELWPVSYRLTLFFTRVIYSALKMEATRSSET
jgi:hypothetical protein